MNQTRDSARDGLTPAQRRGNLGASRWKVGESKLQQVESQGTPVSSRTTFRLDNGWFSVSRWLGCFALEAR